MSLRKSIESGKERRKPAPECGHRDGRGKRGKRCPYCSENKTHKHKRQAPLEDDEQDEG